MEWSISRGISQLLDLFVPHKIATHRQSYVLQVFCDNLTKTYGCVAYLVREEGSNFVMAKAKFAPFKTKTLPQLELASIWLGYKVANYIHKVLSNIDIMQPVIWYDNEAVVQWIRNYSLTITYIN